MGADDKNMCSLKILLVLVSVSVCVCGVNVTTQQDVVQSGNSSKMAWLKSALDHHDWSQSLNNISNIPPNCREQLTQYVKALNSGLLWASKVYDASGQYSSNVMFGSDYWLGSFDACQDLQLAKYYDVTPPFPFKFYVARFNLTIEDGHIPQSRVMWVGECLPASCGAPAVDSVLSDAAALAGGRARSAGIGAALTLLGVRPVPGSYSLLADHKFLILGTTTLVVFAVMLAASIYEGYLERKYRMVNGAGRPDLELSNSHNNNNFENNQKHISSDNIHQSAGKTTDEAHNGSRDLRRESCGLWSELLLCFSVLSNGRAILSTQRPADGALTCIHGIRFMSVIWVIMVHTYLTVFTAADNKTLRTVIERNFLYQSVGNASYSVDTFFFIGGLLVTILFLRSEDKKKAKRMLEKQQIYNKNGFTNSALSVSVISQTSFGQDLIDKPKSKFYTFRELARLTKTFLLMVLYRFIRLTPAYAFVLGLNEIALRYTHYNSVYEPAIFDHITCDKFWWRNLFYLNNLYPQREMCMVWSWYMANDTQFYVVGILLLLISVKHLKFAAISLGVLLTSSWATTIYISLWYQYRARISEPFEMFDALYDKPWSRIGPYLIGIIVAWYLHKTKCQIKIPYWASLLGWPTALAIMGSLIFGMVDGHFEVWPTAFYVSIGHTAWGCAVAWVAVACCCGYGGLVNSTLSYRGFLPLSRLTYCAYLVHPTIMMYVTFLMDGPLHLQNSLVITIYAGFAVMAFLSSFVISLSFEAPAVRLLKIISGGPPKNQRDSDDDAKS